MRGLFVRPGWLPDYRAIDPPRPQDRGSVPGPGRWHWWVALEQPKPGRYGRAGRNARTDNFPGDGVRPPCPRFVGVSKRGCVHVRPLGLAPARYRTLRPHPLADPGVVSERSRSTGGDSAAPTATTTQRPGHGPWAAFRPASRTRSRSRSSWVRRARSPTPPRWPRPTSAIRNPSNNQATVAVSAEGATLPPTLTADAPGTPPEPMSLFLWSFGIGGAGFMLIALA